MCTVHASNLITPMGTRRYGSNNRRVLRQDNIDLDPRKQPLNSLALHIREDVAKKRQVFIMGDFNEDIFDPTLNSYFIEPWIIQRC